jgi:hypothetical protein
MWLSPNFCTSRISRFFFSCGLIYLRSRKDYSGDLLGRPFPPHPLVAHKRIWLLRFHLFDEPTEGAYQVTKRFYHYSMFPKDIRHFSETVFIVRNYQQKGSTDCQNVIFFISFIACYMFRLCGNPL